MEQGEDEGEGPSFVGRLVVDLQGRILEYNDEFLALWKIPEQYIGSSDNARLISFVLDQLVDPGTFLRVTRENQGDPLREYFCMLRFKDGRVIERFSRPYMRGQAVAGRSLTFREVTSSSPRRSSVRAE